MRLAGAHRRALALLSTEGKAVCKGFGRFGGEWPTPHRRVPNIRARDSNNRIERPRGTEKERTKVMRAFDTDARAAMIAEAFRVHSNLVKPHMGIEGQTPGDAAGIALPDGFRWKAVLDAAITRKVTAASTPEGQVKSPD